MSTFSTAMKLDVTTTETLTNDDLNTTSTLLHSGYDVNRTMDATTTPDVTAVAYQTFALITGAKTVDLTSLLLRAEVVSLTSKKPRTLLITALSTNSGNLTIAKGASNGYDGLGSAFSIVLEPGMSVAVDFTTQGNAVTSGNKTLDLSGTGTDQCRFSIAAGT